MGEAFVASIGRPVRRVGAPLLTNFYPRYNAANDQVDPIIRVQPVAFQRVIPRYDLSTSETRDTGLGPAFIANPWLGSMVDLRV